MSSPIGQKAIDDAFATGRAVLKFVSRNDVGVTGGHQSGFLLPKIGWQLFSPFPPEKGENRKTQPEVMWQDGTVTQSVVTWYGKGTRSEYRLTRFGRDFPFLNADLIGDLMVLVPLSHEFFLIYFLDLDEDIEAIQAALRIEIIGTSAVYDSRAEQKPESDNECINRYFRNFAEQLLTDFPLTKQFAETVYDVLNTCLKNFAEMNVDDKLLRLVDEEYTLFRMVERKLTEPEVTRLFRDVDDFLNTASSIMNRRKSRAGKSLENHVENLLAAAGLPFESQPRIDGHIRPDILIPGTQAYYDISYPVDKLFVVGVKRTCKDRWRQVLNEAKRIPQKHILTLQPGISANQLQEMQQSGVTLIVPQKLHKEYPKEANTEILSLSSFIAQVKDQLRSNG